MTLRYQIVNLELLMLCAMLSALCLLPGCKTPTPAPQPLMRVAVQPRPMLTATAPGNEYEIVVSAITNRPDWPACDQFGLPIPKRVHIQLSVDGGSNYTKTIAYGVPVVASGDPVTNRSVSYTYSLPWWDETFISERAMIRVTDLEVEQMGRSEMFTIAGLFWHSPPSGAVLTHGANVELEWVQAGVGDSAELGYITPTAAFTPTDTLTNLVVGTNIINWRVSGLPYPEEQLRLVLRSVSDPKVWGWTGVVTTE
jgi:hypothetical protein